MRLRKESVHLPHRRQLVRGGLATRRESHNAPVAFANLEPSISQQVREAAAVYFRALGYVKTSEDRLIDDPWYLASPRPHVHLSNGLGASGCTPCSRSTARPAPSLTSPKRDERDVAAERLARCQRAGGEVLIGEKTSAAASPLPSRNSAPT